MISDDSRKLAQHGAADLEHAISMILGAASLIAPSQDTQELFRIAKICAGAIRGLRELVSRVDPVTKPVLVGVSEGLEVVQFDDPSDVSVRGKKS